MVFKTSIITLMKSIFVLICFFLSFQSMAWNSNIQEKEANEAIKTLYHRALDIQNSSIANKIVWFSSQFIGKPYLLGALGEGPNAQYDQFPAYRLDSFDCDTYVTTVLSLVKGNSLESFQDNLKKIRYLKGKVDYIARNHFASLDFNLNNQKRGLLKDITLNIKDKNKKTVAKWAESLIDKPSWYAHKTLSTIRLQQNNPAEQLKRLEELKAQGKLLGTSLAKIPYIPLTALFIKNEKPNNYLFSQIPQGAIIEIVRPNWNLKEIIGTNLNVSHLGFAIWKDKQLFFRQASSQKGHIVDVDLIDYLKEAQKSPTIKGINIQIVL